MESASFETNRSLTDTPMEPEIFILIAAFVIGTWLTTIFVALKNLSWGAIKKLDGKKDKELIFKAEQWLEKRNNYRITLRLLALINIGCMTVSAYKLLVGKFPDYSHTSMMLIGTVAITFVFVIVTEGVSIGFSHKGWVVLRTSMPLIKLIHLLFAVFTFPAVHLHNRLENRESVDDDDKARMEDEIEAILDHEAHSHTNGLDDEKAGIEESTGKMIRGILDLDETLVREIMTPRVDLTAVDVKIDVKEIRKNIVASGHSRIPVYQKTVDDIIGVIYSKNLLDDDAVQDDTPLSELMHTPIYIPETKNVDDLLQEFKQNKVHLAVVIDEYGGTAGIVTLEDILEEIVGEIADEFDGEEEVAQPLTLDDDGWLELDGRTEIEDVYEVLNVPVIEDEDNVTIGGYVSSNLGRIPEPGEQVSLPGILAKILDADARRVTRLRIKRSDGDESSTQSTSSK